MPYQNSHNSQSIAKVIRVCITIALVLSMTACDYLTGLWSGKAISKSTSKEITQLTLAVSPHVAWTPWFFAEEEGIFKSYMQDYKVDIHFISGTYADTIEQFINGKVDAVAITNIDAIARLIKHNIEADVILITSYSNGSDAVLLHVDTNTDIRGQTVAVVEYSAKHYLLDRYLMRNQIPFESVKLRNVPESDLPATFISQDVYGVAAGNPNMDRILQEQQAKILFDSRQIPNEIMDLIVVKREILTAHPDFAKALLAAWFSVMEKLKGSSKGPTLDTLARLSGLPREVYEKQLEATRLNDTPTKALSAIRDRSMKKTMRFIRYFMERHSLTGDKGYTEWVSYPGRTPALLHFNGEPLQGFIAPTENQGS
ncbi:MAG: hypothetical protein BWK79_01360 [Beggiatoa sp. IS2]|nr:MAG: hypothetical protein BWK79_01360 [Beggiatoa sp. IS2]